MHQSSSIWKAYLAEFSNFMEITFRRDRIWTLHEILVGIKERSDGLAEDLSLVSHFKLFRDFSEVIDNHSGKSGQFLN